MLVVYCKEEQCTTHVSLVLPYEYLLPKEDGLWALEEWVTVNQVKKEIRRNNHGIHLETEVRNVMVRSKEHFPRMEYSRQVLERSVFQDKEANQILKVIEIY